MDTFKYKSHNDTFNDVMLKEYKKFMEGKVMKREAKQEAEPTPEPAPRPKGYDATFSISPDDILLNDVKIKTGRRSALMEVNFDYDKPGLQPEEEIKSEVSEEKTPSWNAVPSGGWAYTYNDYSTALSGRPSNDKPVEVIDKEELEKLRANQKPEDWDENQILVHINDLATALTKMELTRRDIKVDEDSDIYTEIWDGHYDLIFKNKIDA